QCSYVVFRPSHVAHSIVASSAQRRQLEYRTLQLSINGNCCDITVNVASSRQPRLKGPRLNRVVYESNCCSGKLCLIRKLDFDLAVWPLPFPDTGVFVRKRRLAELLEQSRLHFCEILAPVEPCATAVELAT